MAPIQTYTCVYMYVGRCEYIDVYTRGLTSLDTTSIRQAQPILQKKMYPKMDPRMRYDGAARFERPAVVSSGRHMPLNFPLVACNHAKEI